MTDQEMLKALASHPFMQGLDAPLVRTVAECARRVTASAGQFLGREKEPADAFYLIESGRLGIDIHTPDRGAVRIQTLGPGEIVGWSWLVPPYYWQFDAPILEPLQAIALNAECLRAKCELDHELGYQVLKRLVKVIVTRLAGTRLQILDSNR
jgi:CRP-like cAMP-binding protein